MEFRLTRKHITFFVFAAITFLFGLTPLGYIELSGIDMTFTHIPVIVGSVVLGPLYGAGLGFVFGITSLIRLVMGFSSVSAAMTTVVSTSVGAISLGMIILFVPRILTGLFPFFIRKLADRFLAKLNEKIRLLITGAAGSLVNTVLFMAGIWFFSAGLPMEAYGFKYDIFTYVKAVGINGIAEAVVSAGVTLAAVLIFVRFNKNEDE